MQLLAVGHKRTGACPTFERPVLQRDGLLLRVPLVGGHLAPAQARAVAEVAGDHGNGTIELTNRGNLQIRGVREDGAEAARSRLRAAGLGEPGAALVTASPFAGAREHGLRAELLVALGALLADGPALAPKFSVHVDDAGGWTAGRRAEVVLAPDPDGCTVRVPGVGGAVLASDAAAALVVALADACRSLGDQTRVADLLDAAVVLPPALAELDPHRPEPLAAVGAPGPLGAVTGPDGLDVAAAAPVLGRLDPALLRSLADLAGAPVRVTPWRSIAVPAGAGRAADLIAELAALGLVVDPTDAAAGVIACTGAAGCWQTEADALAEARRQIARRRTAAVGGGVLHVSGCDKRCATRGAVDVTLVGRIDGSGFDEVRS